MYEYSSIICPNVYGYSYIFVIEIINIHGGEIMDTKNQEPLKLTSMAPLDDGGRKYNIIYVIAVVIGVILGICAHNEIYLIFHYVHKYLI